MEEQSVLDYLKERLSLRRLFHPGEADHSDQELTDSIESIEEAESAPSFVTFDPFLKFPWRSFIALVLALLCAIVSILLLCFVVSSPLKNHLTVWIFPLQELQRSFQYLLDCFWLISSAEV